MNSVFNNLPGTKGRLQKRTFPELQAEAARVCDSVHGNAVLLRGLVEFSNYCIQNCAYCGIRRDNAKAVRYRLSEDQILETVSAGFTRGLRTFVLQSGEDPAFSSETLCRLVEKIKELTRGEAAVTLSCGIKKPDEYRALRKAGADRYLLRFETSDPSVYRNLKNGEKLSRRLQALEDIRSADFETGSGFMTSLPGETQKTREKNVLLCRELDLDMAGIGPFIPHGDTPLKDHPRGSLSPALEATALLRIMLPKAHIPATTAAGSLQSDGRELMLKAGANVLMPNITPVNVKKHYLLYPGKICLDESGLECIGCLELRVASVGRKLSFSRGDSLRVSRERRGGRKDD